MLRAMKKCNIPSRSAPLDMTSLQERDAAAIDDRALVRYQAKWEKALARLQRAHPARWSVRGWSPEEVRAELTLRLIEVLRGDRSEHARWERDGKEWALV